MLLSKVTRLNLYRPIHTFQNHASHAGRVTPWSPQTQNRPRNRRAFGLLPHLALPLYRLALEPALNRPDHSMGILRTEHERQQV
jgi:hypothetical protein